MQNVVHFFSLQILHPLVYQSLRRKYTSFAGHIIPVVAAIISLTYISVVTAVSVSPDIMI